MGAPKISDNIQEQLDNLAGRSWMYLGRQVDVRAVNRSDGQVRVLNQGNAIVFPVEEAQQHLEEFLPVDGLDRKTQDMAIQVFNGDKDRMNNLEEILLNNIKKVNEDPDFIPQAKEVKANADSLIKLQKQKVDMVREFRKLKG